MIKSKLFSGLSPEECEEFIEYTKPSKILLKKNESLCDEGMLIDSFGILLTGRLKGAKYRYDGTLDFIEIYTKSDIVNLETVCTPTRISPVQISAMEESEIMLFDHKIVYEVEPKKSNYFKIQANIIQILANENVKKLYKIDVLYKKALRDRIMVFLRHLESRLGSSEFHIRMDREQFAQYLGVNRSALSHELSLMRKEGIIDFKKDFFRLLKPKSQD